METLRVRLGESYPISIDSGSKGWLGAARATWMNRSLVILTSPRVARHCLPTLKRELKSLGLTAKVLLIPDGEKNKNLKTVLKAYTGLLRLGVDRHSTALILGGGVIGDLGGFVAATYLRGIPFIHIPTTLVAQVDSAIGGKLGVDLPEGKNLVGVFRQPSAVLSHVPFLQTLPDREFRGGLGEVIKYGLIRDPDLFRLVTCDAKNLHHRSPKLLKEIVVRCSQIKARVVEQDEYETSGLRRVLNFGHTFGHAVERLTGYRRYLHGEAVGIGMVLAAHLSARMGLCHKTDASAVEEAIRGAGLPIGPPRFSSSEWIRALAVDKKSREGKIHFVFLKKIGQVVVKPVTAQELVSLL